MSAPSPLQYRLSGLLDAHTNDVRSVCGDLTGTLFSTSRDKTARKWARPRARDDQSGGWQLQSTITSTEWINASAWLAHPSDSAHPGYLLTGGQDSIINVWDLAKPSDKPPVHSLLGHRHNVCAIHVSPDSKRIVSGSWDGTARVWSTFPDFAPVHELGHGTYGVWDVLAVSCAGHPDTTATACADGLVRLWQGNQVRHVYKGHTGPVRALCPVSSAPGQPDGFAFASASNDGSIRIWHLDGSPGGKLRGHDGDFVYALTKINEQGGSGLASSGEDGIIRVWSEADGSLVQEVLVPALSVWCLTSLANGDLAAGCSDNRVWVFTRDAHRLADEATTVAYEAGLAARKPKQAATPALPLSTPEVLKQPGNKKGDIKLVEAGGKTSAWQWDGKEWVNLGEVVSGGEGEAEQGGREKTEHEGTLYDFVLSVDVSDDKPHLKLCFDEEDDLVEVARAFRAEHELPESYVERIVEFMQQAMGN